jgi:hypothetical protein
METFFSGLHGKEHSVSHAKERLYFTDGVQRRLRFAKSSAGKRLCCQPVKATVNAASSIHGKNG